MRFIDAIEEVAGTVDGAPDNAAAYTCEQTTEYADFTVMVVSAGELRCQVSENRLLGAARRRVYVLQPAD